MEEQHKISSMAKNNTPATVCPRAENTALPSAMASSTKL